jgi:NAD(P)-dependent dehydrogenase (short-subunit alcohol dehydrogenase family)
MNPESFRYDGKRALVVGGATGMGAATAELVQQLGAEVVVMDFAPVTLAGVTAISLDLRDRDGIDAAVDECGGPIHALFSCAGVADGTPGIEKINFIGHRHLIDRVIEKGHLVRGSAIGMISSTAGLAWERNLPAVLDYLATPDFDAAVAWIEEHAGDPAHPGNADYMWSKQAVCGYVASQAYAMQKRGIRINAIMPGPTDTPLAQANADLWLAFGTDYRDEVGVKASTPEEQAAPLAFLCSDAAAYVNGQTVITDAGYVSSGLTESFAPAKPVVDFLLGNY